MGPSHRAAAGRWSHVRRHGASYRRLGMLSTVALVAGLLVGAPQVASAAEPRVLRTVDVTVGDDGSVTAVRSTLVSDDGSGEVTTDTEELAPGETDLPVRVLTTYRTSDGSGTDLSDLAGYSGPLTIDVAVQNTTVRPTLLSYASGGVGVTEHALVGSPLTVVGGVTLPGATRVVTAGADGAPATNGVLGQDADGTSVVQWSAVLAPPQLAATATFSLVLDVDDFEVPTFDLSVQPGLVTDPSVENLLASSFSDAPGSSRTLQLATLATIGGVSSTLTEVGTTLDEISGALSSTAGSFGTNARGGLQDANGTLRQRLDGSVAQLASASAQVGATIDTAERNGSAALVSSLADIRQVLGTEGGVSYVVPDPGASCASTTLDGSSSSLLGLLAGIRAGLEVYADTTAACRDEIVASLTTALGSDAERDDPSVCSTSSPSAVCLVEGARGGLDDALAQLDELASGVDAADDAADTSLAQVSTTISTLQTAVQGLGTALSTLSTTGVGGASSAVDDAVAGVDGQLGALRDDLVALQVLTSATGDLAGDLETIATTASDQLALVGPGGSLRSGIGDLLGLVCSIGGGSKVSADLAALLGDVLALDLCPGDGADVLGQLDAVEQAWTDVAALVGTGSQALPARLAALDDVVLALLADLDAARGALTGATTGTGTVTTAFAGLLAQVEALSSTVAGVLGTPVDELDCDTPTAATDSFAGLTALWAGASCRLDAVDDLFGDYVDHVGGSLATADGSLGLTAGDLLGIRDEANGELSAYLDDLGQGLTDTGEGIESTGTEQVEGIDAQAGASTASARAGLAQNLRGARAVLTSNLGATQAGLGATRADLAADLDRVLAALGAPTAADGSGGSGIIGSLDRNAAAAGSSLSVVTEATGDTAAFSARRALDLRAIDRAQEQFRQASVIEREVSTAGVDDAASVVTVFTFHVGGH